MSRFSKLTLTVAAAALGWAAPKAKADTITFDSLAGMTATSSGAAVPAAARLSDQLLSPWVRFSSTADHVAVVSLGSGHAVRWRGAQDPGAS